MVYRKKVFFYYDISRCFRFNWGWGTGREELMCLLAPVPQACYLSPQPPSSASPSHPCGRSAPMLLCSSHVFSLCLTGATHKQICSVSPSSFLTPAHLHHLSLPGAVPPRCFWPAELTGWGNHQEGCHFHWRRGSGSSSHHRALMQVSSPWIQGHERYLRLCHFFLNLCSSWKNNQTFSIDPFWRRGA